MSDRVSLQDIADSLGISRGTVDRAIHGRGRISRETREKVLAEARRLGYIDKKLSSFLSLQQELKIVVLIPGCDPFFEKIEEGIKKAVNEMMPVLHPEIIHTALDEPEQQADFLFSVARGKNVSGLLIVPSEDPGLCDAINSCESSGIRVATLNTDAPGSRRTVFIGQDLYASGRAAGELMLKMNCGPVVILSGYENIWAHSERIRGFKDIYKENGRLMDLIGPFYTHDLVENTAMILKKIPDSYSGLFTVSGLTTEGAGRFVHEKDIEGLTLVGFDCTDENISLLKSGNISCLISQSPQLQGYQAVRRLVELLRQGESSVAAEISIPIDLYFRENINFYRNHLEL
ncbi:MAG: LacI family DNA-binding transcriptional regulator [Spirochaetales bacterium]|uniref:LacI family DNA-binding transcriptional regulator n=1 Tax=Candidatus Thalassospirochaeta sargassi TaxID=3119039 RepID=A0AAJ1IG23_9SPIO|nr:LacI family DNA-binding transcriptional regulator [Spirochaetales bacterium]